MEKMNIWGKLAEVQKVLDAPKNQYNSFGKYKYRSCEDILAATKPLCIEKGLVLTLNDEVVIIGDRYYVEATATVIEIETGDSYCVKAKAREPQDKKGCDSSQITGASSSYARKYALNGMFCIEDNKDADSMDNRTKAPQKANKAPEKSIQSNQLQRINILISELGVDTRIAEQKEKIYKWLGIKSLKSITESQANSIINKLIAAKKIKKEGK